MQERSVIYQIIYFKFRIEYYVKKSKLSKYLELQIPVKRTIFCWFGDNSQKNNAKSKVQQMTQLANTCLYILIRTFLYLRMEDIDILLVYYPT